MPTSQVTDSNKTKQNTTHKTLIFSKKILYVKG